MFVYLRNSASSGDISEHWRTAPSKITQTTSVALMFSLPDRYTQTGPVISGTREYFLSSETDMEFPRWPLTSPPTAPTCWTTSPVATSIQTSWVRSLLIITDHLRSNTSRSLLCLGGGSHHSDIQE